MTEKILIVEDEFIVGHDLRMILTRAKYTVAGVADSVKKALKLLDENEVDLVLLDIFLKGKQTGIDLAKVLMQRQVPFIYVSANSNEKVMETAKETMPYGFIIKPYREKDVLLSIDIARYRKEHQRLLQTSSKLFMEEFILDTSVKPISWQKKVLRIAGAFQHYIPFDFLILLGAADQQIRFSEIGIRRQQFNEYDFVSAEEFIKSSGTTAEAHELISTITEDMTRDGVYTRADFEELIAKVPMKKLLADTYGLRSNLIKSVPIDGANCITFSFYSRLDNVFKQEHLDLLQLLNHTLAKNLGHIIDLGKANGPTSIAEIPENSKFNKPKAQHRFPQIIGQSPALLNLLEQVLIVAPTDTAVLITGESGTGKEIIAQNLHQLSRRNEKKMITVNCAALPADLIESILFGHEKGAFTGAIGQRTGKFEEASGGTIFLDEIGEMPVDLQAKLLRVLQEKEIERIGGKMPIQVDLRIIAATNRSLEKEIAKGKFRLDLFYRLNVFPIEVPPLRSRNEDIPALVSFFIQKHAQALNKDITGYTQAFINKMLRYNWPGNIRELEHVVLRTILLSRSTELEEHLLEIDISEEKVHSNTGTKTILENERDHIITVLNKCKGRIAGAGGAADLLGIPSTTLNSKIRKLGIKR